MKKLHELVELNSGISIEDINKPYVPFTYLLVWEDLRLYYYGSKTSAKAHPSMLWNTYFSSSDSVRSLTKTHGNPTKILIDKIFETSDDAFRYEEVYLRSVNAQYNPFYLNRVHNVARNCNSTLIDAYDPITAKFVGFVDKYSEEIKSGKYIPMKFLFSVAVERDTLKIIPNIKKNDPRFKSGEFLRYEDVYTTAFCNKTMNYLGNVLKTDSRFDNGEIISVNDVVKNDFKGYIKATFYDNSIKYFRDIDECVYYFKVTHQTVRKSMLNNKMCKSLLDKLYLHKAEYVPEYIEIQDFRKVVINGVVYDSITIAANAFNIVEIVLKHILERKYIKSLAATYGIFDAYYDGEFREFDFSEYENKRNNLFIHNIEISINSSPMEYKEILKKFNISNTRLRYLIINKPENMRELGIEDIQVKYLERVDDPNGNWVLNGIRFHSLLDIGKYTFTSNTEIVKVLKRNCLKTYADYLEIYELHRLDNYIEFDFTKHTEKRKNNKKFFRKKVVVNGVEYDSMKQAKRILKTKNPYENAEIKLIESVYYKKENGMCVGTFFNNHEKVLDGTYVLFDELGVEYKNHKSSCIKVITLDGEEIFYYSIRFLWKKIKMDKRVIHRWISGKTKIKKADYGIREIYYCDEYGNVS